MLLLFAPPNQILKITKISTNDKLRHHLENLGIIIGQEIILLSNSENVIIKIKDCRLAINKNLALQIQVK